MELSRPIINRALFMYCAAKKGDTTQKKIAATLGMTETVLANRLKGKTDFRYSEIKKYKEIYNVSSEDILNIFFEDCEG